MISNSRSAIQADFFSIFCRFLSFNIEIHLAKLSDNIMLSAIGKAEEGS